MTQRVPLALSPVGLAVAETFARARGVSPWVVLLEAAKAPPGLPGALLGALAPVEVTSQPGPADSRRLFRLALREETPIALLLRVGAQRLGSAALDVPLPGWHRDLAERAAELTPAPRGAEDGG